VELNLINAEFHFFEKTLRELQTREISGSHGGDYEDGCLLGS
jgi:hypothetical protein